VVFVAGCEKDLLPLRIPGPQAMTEAELAEERRLLFVGITRARARLYLTCASQRTRHGSARETGPSPFLAALDPALLGRSGPGGRPGQPARQGPRQLRLL
jgi:DNA helicase II / ATP-dependent DNA helicase PcrA